MQLSSMLNCQKDYAALNNYEIGSIRKEHILEKI